MMYVFLLGMSIRQLIKHNLALLCCDRFIALAKPKRSACYVCIQGNSVSRVTNKMDNFKRTTIVKVPAQSLYGNP